MWPKLQIKWLFISNWVFLTIQILYQLLSRCVKESRCRFEPPPEEDDFDLDIFGSDDPYLGEIEFVPKTGLDDLQLPKPEEAACYDVDLRFGEPGEEPEEIVCCYIDNIEADLCDGKEGYTCMEESVRI